MSAPPHRPTPRWPTIAELVVTRRLVRLVPVVVAAAVVTTVVLRADLDGEIAEVLLAAAMAIATAGTLGDRAAETLAAAPSTRAHRATARLVLVVPVVAVSWSAARGVLRWLDPSPPVAATTTSWATACAPWLLLATVVVAAMAVDVTVDRSGTIQGTAGAATVLVATAVSLHLPPRLNPYPVADHLGWWSGFAALATVFLLLALADPGRTRRGPTSRPADRRLTPSRPQRPGRSAVRGSR